MRENPRGPYRRLRWWCNDGQILPPEPYACVPFGGGHQHGEYSADRQRLAELGWSVGTVLTALSWEEFWDAAHRNQRMRELVLERYLTQTGDGWVMRKARSYRGRIQIEDEEHFGRELLVKLLTHSSWVRKNYLLARELARSLPHHGGEDRTRSIRRLAQDVAEEAPDFEPIRIKVHSDPGLEDVNRVESWLAGPGAEATALAKERAGSLLGELRDLYGPERDWIGEAAAQFPSSGRYRNWVERLQEAGKMKGGQRLERLAQVLRRSRELLGVSPHGARNLAVLDVTLEVERRLVQEAFEELRKGPRTRHHLLRLARSLITGCFGVGLLSSRETGALVYPLNAALAVPALEGDRYLTVIGNLERVSGWTLGTIHQSFAEALLRYTALEPRSGRFVDELVRGSPLLVLGKVLQWLARDRDALTGRVHQVLGSEIHGVQGLNPGVAQGKLRWVAAGDKAATASLQPGEIAVLERTVSSLPPVAGILTLAEGSPLSHMQLLARNLGIPNASIEPSLAARLRELEGGEVLFAVDRAGSVVLERAAPRFLTGALPTASAKPQIDAPQPDLDFREPLPLAKLHTGLSGKLVGPKAANLGELARLFPGRVSPAIALPFGFFHAYTSGGDDAPRARLNRAYRLRRLGELSVEALGEELEAVRQQVASIRLGGDQREALTKAMEALFGAPGSYGVFLRSDTNVEDLPGFTGAGLNKTIPHVVGRKHIVESIPEVWASLLSSRALAWRERVLRRPENIYSSVLLQRSVASEKSGVLVTRNLIADRPGITVTAAWGVGGAVDGESAETLVLEPDGTVTLVAEAKTPYQRVLKEGGGVGWESAPPGGVLTPPELEVLRKFVPELTQKLALREAGDGPPTPWDVEFGFENGELRLFQVRPLVQRGAGQAEEVVASWGGGSGVIPKRVDLEEKLSLEWEDGS
jgi:hypothetical protein